MFLLISTLVILSLAAVIYLFQKRQPPQLSETRIRHLSEDTHLRPLFAPDAAELDRAAKEEAAAKRRVQEHAVQQDAVAEFHRARESWLASPSRKTTATLIKLATEAKRGDTFAQIANEILQAHRARRIDGITDNEVAALLDSHIVLLPVEERGSGALFLIRQQIAELRSPAEPEVG